MKSLIILPTYNEKDNIKNLISKILEFLPDIHILVLDDNSVDGTVNLVKEFFRGRPNVHLIVRRDERGRGLAGIEGFKYALENQFDYVVEMDADLSHNPKYIPILLQEIESSDVVVGSRLIKGGAIVGRGLLRNILTRLANIYIRLVLAVKIRDATSGFRCFKREVLEDIPWDSLISKGPSIIEEILYLISKKNYKIKEIPIIFEERKRGVSKLNFKKIISTMIFILRIRIRYA
jgi:dolichol-phosphate mannosyltransferase